MIYHITTKGEWQEAQAKNGYRPANLSNEGFIHCSTAKQIESVANTYFRGQNGLVVLVIDEGKLMAEVRWEAPSGPFAPANIPSGLFPHIYGELNLDAVIRVLPFVPDSTGRFTLPPWV